MATIEYVTKSMLMAKLQTLLTTLKSFIAMKAEMIASLAGKVDKETGKGLSTNDLTDEMVVKINKIDGLVANGGEPNTIDVIKVNGTAATVTDKTVDLAIVSEATIDSKITAATQDFITESAIDNKIDAAFNAKVVIVSALPDTGEEGKLYLVPMTGARNKNKYEEYRWVKDPTTQEGAFELMGPRELDLTGYVQESDLVAATITDEEINALFAGWE